MRSMNGPRNAKTRTGQGGAEALATVQISCDCGALNVWPQGTFRLVVIGTPVKR